MAASASRALARFAGQSGRARSESFFGAARSRRLRHFQGDDAGPNRAIVYEADTLRARARQMVNGDAHAKAAREAFTTTAIGEGVEPRSMHPDKEVRKRIDALWDAWSERCDADGVENFSGLQELVAGAEFDAGEVFIRRRLRRAEDGLPVPLQIQLIESEQLPYRDGMGALQLPKGHTVKAGVERNAIGRRVAYHFYREHPRDQAGFGGGFLSSLELVRMDASEVLHVFAPKRPGQLRGVTWLAAALEMLWQKRQYLTAELDRAGIAARITGAIEQAADVDGDQNPLAAASEAEGAQTPNPDNGTAELDLESGIFPVLEPGQEIKFNNPPIPGDAFGSYTRTILHAIAAALRVPYELLTGDLSNVNFSSIRAGLRQYAREIKGVQRRHRVQFWSVVWEWFIDAAFASGALVDPQFPANRSDYLKAMWTPPRVEFVDPQKEIDAYNEAVAGRLMSRKTAMREMGYRPEEEDELMREDELMPPMRTNGAQQQPSQARLQMFQKIVRQELAAAGVRRPEVVQ